MRVSLITVCRNSQDTLAATLESVKRQQGVSLQHIVIDGASTDSTLDVIACYRDSISISVSESDSGIYDAMNKGLALATGDIIGFLNADDAFEDDLTLSDIVKEFEAGAEGVYGDLVFVEKLNPRSVRRYWRAGAYKPGAVEFGWMPPHPTLYLSRRITSQTGLFDSTMKVSGDYDYILRLLSTGIRLHYLPRVLVRMRLGGASNRDVRAIVNKMLEDVRATRRSGVGGWGTVVCKSLRKLPQLVTRPQYRSPVGA